MKPEWRRFAPLGLILSLLAALTAAGLYMVYRTWGLPVQISLGLAVIGLALYGILNPDGVRKAFTGRQARYGSNALVLIIAFLGILVVINWMGYRATELYPDKTHWDLTEDKENTLATETLDTLAKLPEPVKVQAFFSKRAYAKADAQTLLDRYQAQGKGNFSYEFIDPDEKPEARDAAGIAQDKDGVLYLQMGDRHELVETVSENELTSALYRLMAGEMRSVYFLTGHGERNPEESGDSSLSAAKKALEAKNYKVQVLNLRATMTIPEDAKVIVIAGPSDPVSTEEVKLLKTFVDGGGNLIVMEDPVLQMKSPDAPDPLVDYLKQDWGILLSKDFVVQVAANQIGIEVPGFQMAQHPITEKLQTASLVFFAARSVQSGPEVGNVQRTELVLTTPAMQQCYPYCSWASTDMADLTAWLSGKKSAPNSPGANDLYGPFPVAMAAQNTSTQSKVVVFGDADFAMDAYFNANGGNSDVFLNSVDWASGQEDLINLTPKPATQRFLIPPWGIDITRNLMLLISIFVLPGGIFVTGLLNWIIRRRRG